ncbi:hypothetical protein NL676_029941 [Syzygium grande]|nr:hypothetical protein NL676_029941 [Syzygium grande]
MAHGHGSCSASFMAKLRARASFMAMFMLMHRAMHRSSPSIKAMHRAPASFMAVHRAVYGLCPSIMPVLVHRACTLHPCIVPVHCTRASCSFIVQSQALCHASYQCIVHGCASCHAWFLDVHRGRNVHGRARARVSCHASFMA